MPTKMMLACVGLCVVAGLVPPAVRPVEGTIGSGREYHVSVRGDDTNDGSAVTPLRTISAAARLAQPGEVMANHDALGERLVHGHGQASAHLREPHQQQAQPVSESI